MRFCVVELQGEQVRKLAIQADGGLIPLEAPASLRGALDEHGDSGLMRLAKTALTGKGEPVPIGSVARWLPPVPDPRSFRDFYAFEQHVKTCREKRGQQVVPEWYEIPVFYFSNPGSLIGHMESVRKPGATNDLEIERLGTPTTPIS